MKKSLLLIISRHYNIQYTTLAYRTLFLLSFFLLNLGGVWGQIYIIGDGDGLPSDLPGKEILPNDDGNYTFTITGLTQFKAAKIRTTLDWEFSNNSIRTGNETFNDAVFEIGQTLDCYNWGNDPRLPWKGDYTITITGDFTKITALTTTPKPALTIDKVISIYKKADEENPISLNFYNLVSDELGVIPDENCLIRWDVKTQNDAGEWEYARLTRNDQPGSDEIKLVIDEYNLYNFYENNTIMYAYRTQNYIKNVMEIGLAPTLTFGTNIKQQGCVIECYVANTNSPGPSNPSSGYQVKIELILNEDGSEPFLGKLSSSGKEEGGTQKVDRSETPATINLQMAYEEMGNSANLQYARFYLIDNNGNLVSPEGKLSVKYGNTEGKLCPVTNQGYYIYTGRYLTPSDISVTFVAPNKEYKLYKVVGVFSENMENANVDGDNLTREPDWDLQYTYSFTYNDLDAPCYTDGTCKVEWKKNTGMEPIVSGNPDAWGTSWAELGVEQYVKWYVVKNDNTTPEPLVIDSKRQNGAETWAISVSGFTVTEDVAVLTGQSIFSSTLWDAWGKPAIYAPAVMDFNTAKNYKIICEIYANGTGNGEPNARYTFSLYKSFLGELNEDGIRKGETVDIIDRSTTSLTLSLANVQAKCGGNTIKYARVWLTKIDGTRIDPTEMLLASGMTKYSDAKPTETSFGYYLTNANGIKLTNATLTLPAGSFEQYQVHVALSTKMLTTPITETTYEPDYNYEYTFSFKYPIKTKYKTAIYDTTSHKTTINLFSNWYEVTGDCDVSVFKFKDDAYARWYLTDVDGNVISDIKELTSGDKYEPLDGANGAYRKGFPDIFRNGSTTTESGDYTGYNPTIELKDGVDYSNVRVVCVVTTKTDNYDSTNGWKDDPLELQVKYVYTLMTEEELNEADNNRFVHYIGESHRDYLTPSGATGAIYSWDYKTGKVVGTTNNSIRQDVHQTEYNVFIDPYNINLDNPEAGNLLLTLPIENWILPPLFKKESEQYPPVRTTTEPLAYFRWYDWETDEKSDYLSIYNKANISKLQERPYGLTAIMLQSNSMDKYRDEIGVKINNEGLDELKAGREIVIACDVSRYMDGIVLDGNNKYLLHEPTLSMRYLFHIRPASKIVNEITTTATMLNSVEQEPGKWESLSKQDRVKVFQTYEDNGRVVVPLTSTFALRADLQGLGQYFIGTNTKPIQCNQLLWYSYYVDEEGSLWKMPIDMEKKIDVRAEVDGKSEDGVEVSRGTVRIAQYEKSDFCGAEGVKTYQKVGLSSDEKEVKIGNGTQLHLVGYLSNGEDKQPVIHYELVFIDEEVKTLQEILIAQAEYQDYKKNPDKNNVKTNPLFYRVGEYMYDHLTYGSTLNFDNFFDEEKRYAKPETSRDNYADVPMAFADAEYGYCYPSLYGQCASTWQIYHGGYWDGYGIAPTHSDYTLLKSMNINGVSASKSYNQSFFTYWYDADENASEDGEGSDVIQNDPDYGIKKNRPLYDITHAQNSSKYGTFLYIDAADEARTIAHLEFKAALCASSEIHYSAYIANMCDFRIKSKSNKPAKDGIPIEVPPQVMFRVSTDIIDETTSETKRVPVISFLTGDIYTLGATTTGEWYQVYGSVRIPAELEYLADGTDRTYYVSVDNYCENTVGADYAIDHISFFTSSTTVQVLQSSTPCDESSGIEVAILADADELNQTIPDSQKLYYRIFEKFDDPNHQLSESDAVKGPNAYLNSDEEQAYYYGCIEFVPGYVRDELGYDAPKDGTTGFYISQIDGKVYFQFDKREFNLEIGKTYFVSFYQIGENPKEGDVANWQNPYTSTFCSAMFSKNITPRKLRIDFKEPDDTDYDGTIKIPCDESEAEKNFTITVQYPTSDGGYSANTVLFDFYIGPKSEFKGIKEGDLYLETALEHMREYYQESYASSDQLPTNYKDENGIAYTEDMRNLIAKHMDEGKLILSATNEFNYTFTNTGEYRFAAIPVDRWTADGYICSPLEFVFDVEKAAGGPQLDLGFKDVEYPGNYTRIVRVGLEQLDNVKEKNGTYTLHIPVHSFEYKNDTEGNSIVFDGSELVLWSTNDPTVEEGKKPVVATLLNDDANADRPMVNDTHQYLAVKFNDDFTFHEGYQYELHTVYYDSEDDEDGTPSTNACTTNDLTFIIKVVPKYVTWKGGNKQWNNDTNWNRSKGDELYKEDYKDTQDMDPTPSTYPAYVPMKFTYVTMPSDNIAPSLMNLEIDDSEGIYTQNSMGRDTTDYIRYDMMVRYTEKTCIDHDIDGNIYDCEKFYGNWAKEIYFKPNAELVHQHYLTYEKVWVEKLLTANTWTLMSTPLQNTYAGDMYVPYSTDATKNGRQETEAFQDITFNLTDYSRTKYPIYQRSWAQTGSTVYTASNDIFRSDYSANLSGTISETFTQWSHTYNDVTVDYSQWKGFAIRAHKKAQKDNQGDDVLALLRLPKKDESFSYYDWKDGEQETNQTNNSEIERLKYGKLFTDLEDATYVNDNNDVTYGVDYDYGTGDNSLQRRTAGTGEVKVDIEDVQEANGYLLVGNPYLCSIDMAQFRSSNSSVLDGSGYWTYENNKIDSKEFSTDNYIKPLQSFFVKLANNVTTGNIVFNKDMMIDRSSSQPQSAPALTLTASNGRGQSSATLSVGEEARSVETLFDSNLEDVPMVYTVADGQAVSIQQLTELSQPVAFGVTCTASNDPVKVTFTDIDQLTGGEVRVVDAVTGSQTAIGEGDSYTVQPNDYGRYFLLAGTTAIDDKTDVAKGIMVSVRGREVTVTSGEELTQVHALTLNGTTYYETTAIGTTTTSFTLSSGVYIIKAENVAGEQQTVKVVIR